MTEVIDINDDNTPSTGDRAECAFRASSPNIECFGDVPPKIQCTEELSASASKTVERSMSSKSSEDSFEKDEVEFDEFLNRELSRKTFRSNKTNLLCNRVFYG